MYVEGADDFGGAVRYYEAPELVRVAAPIHLKFTVRNAPGIYPSGEHLAGLAVARRASASAGPPSGWPSCDGTTPTRSRPPEPGGGSAIVFSC